VGVKSISKIRVSGHYRYLPWPEMRHAAAALRHVAHTHVEGSAHVITACVVLTAFSVEGFCQTLGPEIFKAEWEGRGGKERLPVLKKLKAIGHALGVKVIYGEKPWSAIREVMEARDELAHPKPAVRKTDEVIRTAGNLDTRDQLHVLLNAKYKPLHNLEALANAARNIDEGLLQIWIAFGESEHTFKMPGGSVWSKTLI